MLDFGTTHPGEGDTHMIDQNKRQRPYPYIQQAIQMTLSLGGSQVLEIGASRQPFNHPISEYHHPCCNDGHSTALFAASGLNLDSVDVNQNVVATATDILKKFAVGMCSVSLCDGIDYLNRYDKRIDLMFLDAWDVDVPMSAERHLDAYMLAKKNMGLHSLILIDDTDVDYVGGELVLAHKMPGGKGRLVVPQALEDGFKVVFMERQTLLKRG